MREFKISQGEIHSSVTRMIKAAPYRAGTFIIYSSLLYLYAIPNIGCIGLYPPLLHVICRRRAAVATYN
jgi:hypothetical protein